MKTWWLLLISRSSSDSATTDLGAGADGQVSHGLGDVGLPDADGAVEDDRFSGLQPAQRGEVADLRGREFRVGGEVEAFEAGVEGLEHPGQFQGAEAVGQRGAQDRHRFVSSFVGVAGVSRARVMTRRRAARRHRRRHHGRTRPRSSCRPWSRRPRPGRGTR
jgi:hypothetical protein